MTKKQASAIIGIASLVIPKHSEDSTSLPLEHKAKALLLLIPSVEVAANLHPDLAYEALTTEPITYPQFATSHRACDTKIQMPSIIGRLFIGLN